MLITHNKSKIIRQIDPFDVIITIENRDDFLVLEGLASNACDPKSSYLSISTRLATGKGMTEVSTSKIAVFARDILNELYNAVH
jgi:hypothetical protein